MSGSRESCLVTTLLPVVPSVVCSSVDGPCHWIETELSLALWERVTVQVRVYTTPTLPLPEPLTSTDISTTPGTGKTDENDNCILTNMVGITC